MQVYQAPDTSTARIDTYTKIAQDNIADVVSASWGNCEQLADPALIQAENTAFQQIAAQGRRRRPKSGIRSRVTTNSSWRLIPSAAWSFGSVPSFGRRRFPGLVGGNVHDLSQGAMSFRVLIRLSW